MVILSGNDVVPQQVCVLHFKSNNNGEPHSVGPREKRKTGKYIGAMWTVEADLKILFTNSDAKDFVVILRLIPHFPVFCGMG